MARMKKFFLYFIMFIAVYIIIDLLTFACMKDNYKDITNYEIQTTSPKIEVIECKASYGRGYIKGTINNDTGEHIKLNYLRIDLYNTKGTYLGTEYKELKYFNTQETMNFDMEYSYTNIKTVKISIVNEMTEVKQTTRINNKIDKWLPLAGGLTVLYILLP